MRSGELLSKSDVFLTASWGWWRVRQDVWEVMRDVGNQGSGGPREKRRGMTIGWGQASSCQSQTCSWRRAGADDESGRCLRGHARCWQLRLRRPRELGDRPFWRHSQKKEPVRISLRLRRPRELGNRAFLKTLPEERASTDPFKAQATARVGRPGLSEGTPERKSQYAPPPFFRIGRYNKPDVGEEAGVLVSWTTGLLLRAYLSKRLKTKDPSCNCKGIIVIIRNRKRKPSCFAYAQLSWFTSTLD